MKYVLSREFPTFYSNEYSNLLISLNEQIYFSYCYWERLLKSYNKAGKKTFIFFEDTTINLQSYFDKNPSYKSIK